MRAPKPSPRFLLAGLAAALLTACGPGGNPNVASTVNGEEIPVDVLTSRMEEVRNNPQAAEQFAADEDGSFEQQVTTTLLGELINFELIEQGAEELGVDVTEADVEERRMALVEELGGEEAFEQLVADAGISEADANEQIRQLALSEAVQAELDGEVTDEDVQAAYDEQFGGEGVAARHILVETGDEAEQILGRLEAGDDFAVLATELSIDTGSGAQGGNLGLVQPGQTVPPFEEALFAAELGEVVGPVESEFGFHVIERLEPPALEDVEDELREGLGATAGQQAFQEWLTERRLAAEVEVNPRFGTWDEEAGQLVPEDPLGDAATQAPDGGGGAPPADGGAPPADGEAPAGGGATPPPAGEPTPAGSPSP